jgi:hypothetical protein
LKLARYTREHAKFWEVLCDEHGIGGGGYYCGNSDAQLGCINVFLAPHTNGPRDLNRCGALSSLHKSPPKGDSEERSKFCSTRWRPWEREPRDYSCGGAEERN